MIKKKQKPKFQKKPVPPKTRPGMHVPTPPKAYEVNEAAELLPFLLTHLENEGRNKIKAILARGQVSINGKPVTQHNHPLAAGDTVVVTREKAVELPPLIGLRVLFEDKDIIVVDKEAGLLSVSSPQETELTAYRQLTDYVRASNSHSRIYVVHRLERDMSGVMLFAKNEAAQEALKNAWQDTVEDRQYAAVVEGIVRKPEGTVTSWLKENKALKMYSSRIPNDGEHAVTHYKLLQANRQNSLLQIHLDTGIKNQIRAHMQDIGHPIAGDKKYGAETKTIHRLGLHAQSLTFDHPGTGQSMRFESPIPKSFMTLVNQ